MSKNSEQTTDVRQQAMLKALTTYGTVRKAVRMVKISPQTHYNWYKNDEAYRDRVNVWKYEAYEDYREQVLEAVFKKLKEGNVPVMNRLFQTFFGKWAEQADRANPYRPRMTARIKYIDKPPVNATV